MSRINHCIWFRSPETIPCAVSGSSRRTIFEGLQAIVSESTIITSTAEIHGAASTVLVYSSSRATTVIVDIGEQICQRWFTKILDIQSRRDDDRPVRLHLHISFLYCSQLFFVGAVFVRNIKHTWLACALHEHTDTRSIYEQACTATLD